MFGISFVCFLEEKFAQAVCFLLVDLYLLTCQAEKALHLLAVLEKMVSQGNNNKNGKAEVFIFIRFIYVQFIWTSISNS